MAANGAGSCNDRSASIPLAAERSSAKSRDFLLIPAYSCSGVCVLQWKVEPIVVPAIVACLAACRRECMQRACIYGPPGVGKFTVAQELVTLTGFKAVSQSLGCQLGREHLPPPVGALAPAFAALLLGAVGAINPITGASISIIRQLVTSHELLGRVTAVINVGAVTALTAGSFAGGLIADSLGLRAYPGTRGLAAPARPGLAIAVTHRPPAPVGFPRSAIRQLTTDPGEPREIARSRGLLDRTVPAIRRLSLRDNGLMGLHARIAVTGLWRQPEFLRLWVGQTVSGLGSRVTLLALPLTAILVMGRDARSGGAADDPRLRA
jgi:hypothetical protein